MIFWLIQSLLPNSRIKKKALLNADSNATKKKLYSVNESRNAFLLLCATETEYREMYDSKVIRDSNVAPYISIIGPAEDPRSFMVDFENITYKFYSFSKASDVCFKAYQVFNLAYPEACFPMWDFIGRQFYGIAGDGDTTKPGTYALLKEINCKFINSLKNHQ